jgi:hypothetical protein
MKITALEESADFATLDTKKLFSKLKSHELSRKGRPNHDVSFSSKALITGARIDGHVANPTNTTDSSTLEFALSSLCAVSDEQYESIPDDEITLLSRKFRALHKFHKEMRRSPRGCFKCGDTTHFIADYPKRKKSDSSNKYNYNNRNDSSDKGKGKKKYRFGNKKKKFQKMMSQACAALSDLDFSSDDEHGTHRRFWADAISTACYISNRIFLHSILLLTPFELQFDRKSFVSHFRLFGCKCFVLKRGNLDKFESRSFDDILLGYTPHGRSYRVYNFETNIVVSHVM